MANINDDIALPHYDLAGYLLHRINSTCYSLVTPSPVVKPSGSVEFLDKSCLRSVTHSSG